MTKIVPVGTLWFGHWLCRTLFAGDMPAEALLQMQRLWGAYSDLPTFPETRIQHGNTGHCHGWSAGPAYLLPAFVLGLQPAKPGWRSMVFQPPAQTGLIEASGTVPSPQGMITAHWQRAKGRISLTLELPPGVTGCVRCGSFAEHVPAGSKWTGAIPEQTLSV